MPAMSVARSCMAPSFISHTPRAAVMAPCTGRERLQVMCSGGQPSRRRSQRLRQQQPRPPQDTEELLRQKMQERLQNEANQLPSAVVVVDDDEAEGVQQTGASAAAAAAAAAPAAADAAAAGAAAAPAAANAAAAGAAAESPKQLAPWQEAALAELEAGLQAAAERGTPAEAPTALQQQQPSGQQQGTGKNELVEADHIVEPPPPFTGDSKAAALLEIIGSGEALEEQIAQHGDMIDADMLEMLAERIQAAEAMEQEQAVQGLQLLYRSLKAEVDRKEASPAMRLLDDLINILDDENDDADESSPESSQGASAGADAAAVPAAEGNSAAGEATEEELQWGEGESAAEAAVASLARQQEARRARAWARIQAAFGGSLPRDADPFTLAVKLAEGGEQLAERLFEEVVEPEGFLREVGQLLERASEQRDLLVEYIEVNRHELEAGQLSELQEALAQRSQALKLVEEVMELVAQWTNQQRQQQLRDWVTR